MTDVPSLTAGIDDPAHRQALRDERSRLLDFYAAARDPAGGFGWLDTRGRRAPGHPGYLWLNARAVHCYAIAQALGHPGADELVRHGLAALDGLLRDPVHGGWFAATDADAKEAYGHAHLLLALSGAAAVGHDVTGLLDAAADTIERRFWRAEDGLCVETYDRGWQELAAYRGANSNMHMTEAFLAAAEVTGQRVYLDRASRIAWRMTAQTGPARDWRLPEHFDEDWRPLDDYNRDKPADPFRPYGSTVGHWLEWSRLLLHLRALTPEPPADSSDDWMLAAARALFETAVTDGWDSTRDGGFYYTVDWDGTPVVRDRFFWPVTEGIGAAATLYRVTGEARYEQWYQRFWAYAQRYLIDREGGGWWHQLDENDRPTGTTWDGKPDLYHILHATLYAIVPPGRHMAAFLRA